MSGYGRPNTMVRDGYDDPFDRDERGYQLQDNDNETSEYDGIFNQAESDEESEEFDMSISELLYSTSSFYAIVLPVTVTMILSSLSVVFINTEESVEAGAQAMANAYQVWDNSSGSSTGETLAISLANGLVMVTAICLMTFVIVLLYRFRCMKCLIGYMILCSSTLLGILGGNMYYTAIEIYRLPVDKISYFLTCWNFAVVGVLAVFYREGIPKYITQSYLVATSVILAWHLDYFDTWTTWTLLVMLALYDLCAVLTPCGPLKALVELMSKDDSPEMPGLLFEAELPPEARRPGVPRTGGSNNQRSRQGASRPNPAVPGSGGIDEEESGIWDNRSVESGTYIEIPLAVARVYNLEVIALPPYSQAAFDTNYDGRQPTRAPLLDGNSRNHAGQAPSIPENPTPTQLQSDVTVKLPTNGGRLEKVQREGKNMYLERDRFGNPKRILWVDRLGRVFAELSDGEDGDGKNSIRLGLGDFIFYSVLVAKAAQYSFATFAACMLVILAGLGGTLVLLSVFHHALPALPISIFLGVFFYLVTRIFMEPWIETVLLRPYYV